MADESSNVTMDELAGTLAARAVQIDYDIDQLTPGSEEWAAAIKAQSVVHQDLLAYEKNSIDAAEKHERIELEKSKTKWAKIGVVLTAIGGVLAAVIKWIFWDHALEVQKKEVVPRSADGGANDIGRSVSDAISGIANKFR